MENCEDCDASRPMYGACGNYRCAECHFDSCSGCGDGPTVWCANEEMCGGREAAWVAGGGSHGETYACSGCVGLHASERLEPGVTWTRLDGAARQTDGLVMIGGAA